MIPISQYELIEIKQNWFIKYNITTDKQNVYLWSGMWSVKNLCYYSRNFNLYLYIKYWLQKILSFLYCFFYLFIFPGRFKLPHRSNFCSFWTNGNKTKISSAVNTCEQTENRWAPTGGSEHIPRFLSWLRL